MTVKRVGFALAAVPALASLAHAQTAQLSYRRLNAGQSVSWSQDGTGRNTWVGSFVMLINASDGPMSGMEGQEINVFCLDPLQNIGAGPADYSQTTPSGLQMAASNGSAKEAAVRRLLGFSNNQHNTTTNANYATAFQLALWEVARDYDGSLASLNPFSGGFRYDESSLGGDAAAVKTDLFAMLAAAGDPNGALTTDTVFSLRNDTYQDLIHTRPPLNSVPEPTALALLGVGVLGLGAHRRRK